MIALLRYLVRRLALALVFVYALASGALLLTRLAPGDTASELVGTGLSPEAIARQRSEQAAEVADELRAVEAEAEGKDQAAYATLRFGIDFNQFVADWFERQALAFAVLAQEAHALLPALDGRGGTDVGADADPPLTNRLETEDGPQQFGSTGAQETGDADDFTAAKDELRSRGESRELDHGFSRLASRAWIEVIDAPAHHEGHDVLRARGGDRALAYAPPVAQHHEPVRDLLHLLEEVRDVDDREALVAEPVHEPEEGFDILPADRARGFVEDQDPAAHGERAAHLDDLPLRDRELADGAVGREVGVAQRPEGLEGLRPDGAPVHDAAAGGFDAE